MNIKSYNLILLSIIKISDLYSSACTFEDKAVVISPVIEASGMSLKNNNLDLNWYKKFFYSHKAKSIECPRLHQLLFNEVVTIRQDNGDEVECELPSFFYYGVDKQKRSNMWILKKNLMPLEYFKNNNLLCTIPAPYSTYLHTGNKDVNNKNILTLKTDYFDKVTKMHFSAGTRFNRRPRKDTKNKFSVILFDPKIKKQVQIFIPKEVAIVNYGYQQNQIDNFLNQLEQFASEKNGVIPYVWGGASTLDRVSEKDYSMNTKDGLSGWNRPTDIATGFDCSGLILKSTQICGMPYFLKNTYTLSKELRPLRIGESLENGDLIWYQGHVIIVSNVERNEVIEAVGYEFGYGRVIKLKLSKLFENINNYQELINAYHNKSELVRLKKDGSFGRNVKKFLLLKIKSIYE